MTSRITHSIFSKFKMPSRAIALISFNILFALCLKAQFTDTLRIQDFEVSPATPTWGYSGTPAGFLTGLSDATNATPTSSPFGIDTTRAWHVRSVSGGNTLTFDNISLPSGYDSFSIVFKLAAMNINGTTGGPDHLDYVLTELSTDGGSSYYDRIRVRGAQNNNCSWAYDATAVAQASYLPASEIVFQPITSGLQTTNGYSTVKINIANTETQIGLKITLRSSSSSDSWLLDNLILLGHVSKPSVTISGTDVSCNGAANGTATAVVSGGTGPFSYLWSTGDSTLSIDSLSPGTYYFKVTDALLDSAKDSITIIQPDVISSAISIVDTNSTFSADYGGWLGATSGVVEGSPSGFVFVGDLNYDHRAWIRFNTSSIPDNSEIDSVVLSLYQNNSANSATTVNMNINAVSGDIGPYGSYNSSAYADFGTGTYTSIPVTGNGYYNDISLGSQAALDLQNALGTDYFQVALDNGNTTWKRFTSNLCSIKVYYKVGPNFETFSCNGLIPSDSLFNKFNTPAGGSGNHIYQWQISNDLGTNWTLAPGKTDSSAYIPTVALTDTTYFRRLVIDTLCHDSIFNEVVKLNVRDTVIAKISPTDVNCSLPHTIAFINQSTGSDTWSWDFDDGNTSTNQNPSNTFNYAIQDTFNVQLIASDAISGCQDTTYESVVLMELRDTISVSAVDSFTSPSGNNTWTTSGEFQDTILTSGGCDSLLTINLTITKRFYVDANQSTSGNGDSWVSPFKTIDEAIQYANQTSKPVQIWVKTGTYYPGGAGSKHRDSSYVITNPNFELLGGFAGTETEPSQRNSTVNQTILCGDIGVTGDSTDNTFHILIVAPNGTDIGSNFVLDGLTFRDGNANGNTKFTYQSRDVYQTDGAAITIIGSGTSAQVVSPTVTNCHFENNYGDYGAIFIKVPKGSSFANISNCTFKGNRSIYGTIFNDGQGGEVSPNITNCAFDNNQSQTSGAAIYNYGYAGKASPTITSCVFNNNRASSQGGAIYNTGYAGTCNPVIFNSTFHDNDAGSHAGAMYSFGNSGTCQPKVTNSIFYKNTVGGSNDDYKFSEFYNYAAYPYISNSSMQRASSTYSSSTANSLNGGPNNIFQTNPNFEAITDGDGADGVWRTGDDGLRLSSSSTSLLNGGTNTGAPTTDILGNQRMGTTDMGAYEYVNCGLNVKLATAVKTHTATQTVVDGGFVCYCNSDNELMLALDTNGTGAEITPSQVQLYIGNPSTLSYNSAGGMITNTAGGVILERRWDVDPTTQPSSPVRVRYFYTNDNYDDIVTAMAGLTSPTTITSPSQLQFYKVTGGSTATFPNPHDTGVTGIVLTNSTTASTTTWVNGTHGVQDHSAEYLVSSFSGGGGGGGGGSEPLPVELIQFEAVASASHTADLTWKTASELNNSHFVVERSYNGQDFEEAAIVQGNGTTQNVITYTHNDNTIELTQNTVFYRLRQVDFDGTTAYSPVRRVDFDLDIITPNKVSLYPNPTKGTITVRFADDQDIHHAVKVVDNLGRVLYNSSFEGQALQLDLSDQATGIYFILLDSGESFKVIKE